MLATAPNVWLSQINGNINPWHMYEGYGSRFVSVYLSVCYHDSCYINHLYVEKKVPLNFLWCSQDIYCVDSVDITLFKSSGNIF